MSKNVSLSNKLARAEAGWWRSVEVFIASSSKALPLANTLRRLIRSNDPKRKINITVWPKAFKTGAESLKSLAEACRKHDFVVVFFTKDDYRIEDKNLKRRREIVPRDNCVYEAGLFTGALNLTSERCFVVTSVKRTCEPSDLIAVQKISFRQPPHIYRGKNSKKRKVSKGQLAKSLRKASKDVISAIAEQGPLLRPSFTPVSADELLKRERISNMTVYVKSAAPLERSTDFAKRVVANITERRISYEYYFMAAKTLGKQIRLLVSALDDSLDQKNNSNRRSSKQQKREKPKNSKALMQSGMLKIFLLKESWPVDFCVHSPDGGNARCYLRYPELNGKEHQFIEWFDGDVAKEMVMHLEKVPRKEVGNVLQCSLGSNSRAGNGTD